MNSNVMVVSFLDALIISRFPQITAADTGVYTCVAVNLVGVAVRNYTVTVDQLGPAGTGGPAQEKQPALPGGPENTTVQQGDTARLECVVRLVLEF